MKARLVMMEGPPGAGKSTLADGIAYALGSRVDLITLASLFERAEFTDVGNAYRTRVWPTAEMLLDAFGRVLERADRAHRLVVADFSVVGLAEELPWAQPDRTSVTTNIVDARADPEVLHEHASDVLGLARDAILFVIDVPVDIAVRRRHAQSGDGWFATYLPYAPRVRPQESVVQRCTRFFEAGAQRREDIVRAHGTAGWAVVTLDATAPADDVLETALAELDA